MAAPDEFTDSTDWLNTPLAGLAPLDAALRCQVCKDFFTTPMITSCSHTFCSLCIRRYLSQEGRCPACRESDQEIKLRRNWSVEEAVTQFKNTRAEVLAVAREREGRRREKSDGVRPSKRRKVVHHAGPGDGEALPERRSTRSQSRRIASQDTQNGYTTVLSSQEEIQDSEEGSVYEDGPQMKTAEVIEPHDGLVACPCCGKRMKEAFINSHLDRCMAGEATPSPRRSNTPQVPDSSSIAYHQTKPLQTQERLPTINYSILNDSAMRKKLKELGIPNHGSRELLRKRHTEWINLWNANCDSLRPVSKQQLLRDLDRWEKTLGRQVDKGPSGVMVKDFDRDNWQKSNRNDFDDLIKKAREKRAAMVSAEPATVSTSTDDNNVNPEAPNQADGLARNGPRSLEAIFDGTASSDEHVLSNGDHHGQASSTPINHPGTSMDLSTDIKTTEAEQVDPARQSGVPDGGERRLMFR